MGGPSSTSLIAKNWSRATQSTFRTALLRGVGRDRTRDQRHHRGDPARARGCGSGPGVHGWNAARARGCLCGAILPRGGDAKGHPRSEEHTSELQSLMRISYAVFCLKKKKTQKDITQPNDSTQNT